MLQYEEVITISIGVGVSGMKDLVGGTIFLPSGQNDARSFKVCHWRIIFMGLTAIALMSLI